MNLNNYPIILHVFGFIKQKNIQRMLFLVFVLWIVLQVHYMSMNRITLLSHLHDESKHIHL